MAAVTTSSVLVKFDFLGQTHMLSAQETIGFVKGLCATMEKSSLVFKNVLLSRAYNDPTKKENVNHRMMCIVGSSRCSEVLEMLSFPSDASNKVWEEYIKGFTHIIPRAKM